MSQVNPNLNETNWIEITYTLSNHTSSRVGVHINNAGTGNSIEINPGATVPSTIVFKGGDVWFYAYKDKVQTNGYLSTIDTDVNIYDKYIYNAKNGYEWSNVSSNDKLNNTKDSKTIKYLFVNGCSVKVGVHLNVGDTGNSVEIEPDDSRSLSIIYEKGEPWFYAYKRKQEASGTLNVNNNNVRLFEDKIYNGNFSFDWRDVNISKIKDNKIIPETRRFRIIIRSALGVIQYAGFVFEATIEQARHTFYNYIANNQNMQDYALGEMTGGEREIYDHTENDQGWLQAVANWFNNH